MRCKFLMQNADANFDNSDAIFTTKLPVSNLTEYFHMGMLKGNDSGRANAEVRHGTWQLPADPTS